MKKNKIPETYNKNQEFSVLFRDDFNIIYQNFYNYIK